MNKVTYTEKRFFEWYEDDVSVTLRNSGASYGGGEVRSTYCSRVVGSLCYDDYKGPNVQYVYSGKLVVVKYEERNSTGEPSK